MDCCHSGTGMDLPYTLKLQGSSCVWRDEADAAMALGDVQMFSGCKDEQTSADAQFGNGEAGGAMTTAFISALNDNTAPTY